LQLCEYCALIFDTNSKTVPDLQKMYYFTNYKK